MTHTDTRPQAQSQDTGKQSWLGAHWKPVAAAGAAAALALAGAAAVVVGGQEQPATVPAAAAASPSASPAPSVAASPTKREAAISAATAALEGYTADVNKVSSDPTAPLSLLDRHGKDAMVSGKPGYRQHRKKGWQFVGDGTTLADIELVEATPRFNPHRVVLRTCTDLTGFKVVDAKGKVQYRPELERFVEVYTVTEEDGKWKVASVDSFAEDWEPKPC